MSRTFQWGDWVLISAERESTPGCRLGRVRDEVDWDGDGDLAYRLDPVSGKGGGSTVLYSREDLELITDRQQLLPFLTHWHPPIRALALRAASEIVG